MFQLEILKIGIGNMLMMKKDRPSCSFVSTHVFSAQALVALGYHGFSLYSRHSILYSQSKAALS